MHSLIVKWHWTIIRRRRMALGSERNFGNWVEAECRNIALPSQAGENPPYMLHL
tara:strand:+ start:1745 stop:1906 length:162 start_codon:yes stop_codon:yes gene_type:complete